MSGAYIHILTALVDSSPILASVDVFLFTIALKLAYVIRSHRICIA